MQQESSRTARRAAAALALITCAAAGQAATTIVTFDTDTASNQQTADVYGLAVDGGFALASGGMLHLQPSSGRVTADIGAFAGDVTLSVDLGFTGLAGSYGMGFRLGDNFLIFHPGFLDGAFRIDGPGGIANTSMGFTPTQAALNHMTLAFDAASARASITIVDGLNPALSYQYVFEDTNYVAGVTLFGIEANGSGVGEFDNLRIQTPVPEPAAGTLLLAGLACVLARTRRRAAPV